MPNEQCLIGEARWS